MLLPLLMWKMLLRAALNAGFQIERPGKGTVSFCFDFLDKVILRRGEEG